MKNLTRFVLVLIAMIALPLTAHEYSPAKPQNKRNNAPKLAFLLRIAYLLPSESAFKEIYGNPQVYSIELRLAKNKMGIWLEGGQMKTEGNLTMTKENTRVTIMPLEAGMLYRFATGRLIPYLGAGAGYYNYEENNDLGNVQVKETGFVGLGGLSFHSGRIMFDLKAKYSYCKIYPDTTDENIEPIENNIGGISFSLGLGLGF